MRSTRYWMTCLLALGCVVLLGWGVSRRVRTADSASAPTASSGERAISSRFEAQLDDAVIEAQRTANPLVEIAGRGNVTIARSDRPCLELRPPTITVARDEVRDFGERSSVEFFARSGSSTVRSFDPGAWRVSIDGEGWTATDSVEDVPDRASSVTWTLQARPRNELSGLVMDAIAGEPVAEFEIQAQVELNSDSISGFVLFEPHRVEDVSGRFCLCAIPVTNGRVRLVVSALGFERAESEWIPGSGVVRDLAISLTPLARVRQLVTGRVTSARDGRPVQGAAVRAFSSTRSLSELWVVGAGLVDPAFSAFEPDRVDPEASLTDEFGRYRLQSALEGSARIVAFQFDHRIVTSESMEFVAGGRPLAVDIALELGATIEGLVVTDADSARRVQPVSIEVRGPDFERSVPIDARSTFRLGGLVAGEYELTVQARVIASAGAETSAFVARRRVSLKDQAVERVEISLLPGATGAVVNGRIQMPSDLRIESAMIGALSGALLEPDEAASIGQDGTFELANVPQGGGWLFGCGRTADGSRGFAVWRPHTFGAPGTASHIEMRGDVPGIRIHSARHAEDLNLARGAALSSEDPLGSRFLAGGCRALVGRDGIVAWYGLPPGRYSARIESIARPIEFEITPGEATVRDVEASRE